jgi:ryanodine receptor 2
MYIPKPIETEDVQLSDELKSLSEILAKHVHDVWAKERIRQGWELGPVRNDVLRQTPCLVPYEELTEEEKDYDRNTSQETLKLLLKLGYKIEKD